MITLKESSLVDYIFLSREIPLPLKYLMYIRKNKYSFNEVMNFSEKQFRSIILSIKSNYKIPIRNIDEKVSNFVKKKSKNLINEIQIILNICKENKISCYSFFDKNYPTLLRTLKLPPKLIFIKGEIKPQDYKAVAIIGTRKPTEYGKEMARKISIRFTELGFTIVSGFARGVDTIAMESALECGGRAIGVIASGILNLYPKENNKLVEKLINNGALISEKYPYKSVDKKALQIRNRITSGLGLGNVIIEGNRFSGTLHQLKYGDQQGKPAITVQPIGNYEQSFIPNKIINEKGGVIIKEVKDIDFIAEMLLNSLNKRKQKEEFERKKSINQVNLFKF